jgi:hypothetical protein
MTTDLSAREIRVHGVGGPQATKILGENDETRTFTLRPDAVDDRHAVPPDPKSRVVRRLADPSVVAYEWGGLTLGNFLNALWVVYLPLTVLNDAGWSHRPGAGRIARGTSHVVCALGTLTYVGWIGYLLLDIVGRQWRQRLLVASLPGWLDDIVRTAGLPIAYAVFGGVLGLLWWINRRSGTSFEEYAGLPGDPAPTGWRASSQVIDPEFFRQVISYRRRRRVHTSVAVAGAVAVVWLASTPAHPGTDSELTLIGLGLLVLGLVQVTVLSLWWVAVSWTRAVAQVTFATIGTVLCHVWFSGVSLFAVDQLGHWPRLAPTVDQPIVAGRELGLTDHFVYALMGAAVAGVVLAAVAALRAQPAPGYPSDDQPRLVTRAMKLAVPIGAVVAISFLVSVGGFGLVSDRFDVDDPTEIWSQAKAWYDGQVIDANAAQRLGARILALLPLLFVAVLSKPRTGRAARILGNVWDVMTFWPRRFHPFGIPPYSERAVPELRWIIRRRRSPGQPLVVAGHSQGSVLSFAAVGAELHPELPSRNGPVTLVTFGSPTGTLYASAFPAYFGPRQRAVVASRIAATGGQWINIYRSTDPISGPVTLRDRERTSMSTGASWQDVWLPDPRLDDDEPRPTSVPPLERLRPWGSVNGHNFYLADRTTRAVLDALRIRRLDESLNERELVVVGADGDGDGGD